MREHHTDISIRADRGGGRRPDRMPGRLPEPNDQESDLHALAATGFGAAADAYARGRPGYPAAVGRWLAERLGLGPRSLVVDLAAGTGKLTSLLVGTGARVLAVEPVQAMRQALSQTLPRVPVVGGLAESIPLADHTVDVVAVGQAFHWFRGELAVPEIARVLRPRGSLAVVFNNPDVDQPAQARLGAILAARRGSAPHHHRRTWQAALAATPLFELVGEQRVRNQQTLDTDRLIDRVVSVSYIAALPPTERAEVAAEVRGVADAYGAPLTLHYLTEALLYTRT
jgi:SAM-dependent methyltransferase